MYRELSRADERVNRKPPRPSWALAYITQDWRRYRVVSKAYRLASADDDIDDLSKRPSVETFDAVRQARKTLSGYVRALDAVLEDWDESKT